MNENKTCTCPVCNREVNSIDGFTSDEQIVNGIITLYKEIQEKKKYPTCPRCGYERMTERNALSKQFDIEVCPDCGTDEAVRAAADKVLPAMDWWIVREIYKLREH